MNTALVHDWLVSLGGAEKVLSHMAELYPSPIYTLLKDSRIVQGLAFEGPIHTSFLQHIPFSSVLYRNLLPLFPRAIEQFDLAEYNLILSSSHAVAKGVITHPEQLHICYCHSPMRYAWDLYDQYLSNLGVLKSLAARWAVFQSAFEFY